jgi:lipid-binding SYLF domain-containing protein
MMRTLVPTRDMHFRQFSTEKREGKVATSGLQLWEMAITKPALLAAIFAIAAEAIGKQAKAILVFPNVVKGGFLVAAHHGDGALLFNGRAVAYYNTVGGSYGLQAGIQKSSYAMFFYE